MGTRTIHPSDRSRDRTPRVPRAVPRREEGTDGGDAGPESGAAPRSSRSIDAGRIGDLRIVDEQGVADPALDPNLPDAELRRIHRAMVLTRKFDLRMLTLQRQGKMGTFAPGYGQEATQIGQVYPLGAADWFAPSYRSFGAQIWRGWEMERLLLLWDGFFEGFAPPPDVRDLPFSIVIGSHVPPAVGVALGIQYRGEEACVVANFGDGALSQGNVAEALNFAAVYAAPIVFVCENNGWAISTRVRDQAATETLAQRGLGFGIPSVRVDGNDVLAVIVACREGRDRARRGGGPTFIEAVTYRMSMHTTADDPKVYRDEAEVEAWKAKCPILRFERYLVRRGVLAEADCARVADECEQAAASARDRFLARAIPNPREVFDFIYGDMPAELEAQKREYLEKLARKLDRNADGKGGE
jgi:TPP-dependent pyruvate/acetoin dehydrogenase alpha subunit